MTPVFEVTGRIVQMDAVRVAGVSGQAKIGATRLLVVIPVRKEEERLMPFVATGLPELSFRIHLGTALRGLKECAFVVLAALPLIHWNVEVESPLDVVPVGLDV